VRISNAAGSPGFEEVFGVDVDFEPGARF
jgi:hypothetical protein